MKYFSTSRHFYVRTNHSKGILNSVVTFSLLFLLSSCCKTLARFGGIIGKDNQTISVIREKDAGYEIWICPNTPVTLGWYVSSDVKTVTIDNGLGLQQKIPFGTTTVTPTTDITYTLTASGGDCDKTATVFIKIIKPGTKGTINVPLFKNTERIATSYWETYLDPNFYDPNIIITSISIDHDDFGGTQKGWKLGKVNTDGSIGSFVPIMSILSTPSGFPLQLAGKHNITPFNPLTPNWSTAPSVLTETLTLDCKK
jgi:hypothetical protein